MSLYNQTKPDLMILFFLYSINNIFAILINFLLWISLEVWYFMAIILFAGYLKNAEISVAALSIW